MRADPGPAHALRHGLLAGADLLRQPPAQQRVVDEIVKRLQGIDPTDVVVNYSLDKATADPWNMIAGASYDFSKSWAARVEAGFIGRKSVLMMLNYRFEW